MIIDEVCEHKLSLELLPKKANILDIGCRNFLFTKAMRVLGHTVFPVDIDKLNESQAYYQVAISNYDGRAGIIHSNDPQATRIKEGSEVPCYTLESFSKFVGVEMWDLVKIDVEGAEWEIIMGMNKPMAKQISVEMHLHTGFYTINEVNLMVAKLQALGYKIASHEMTAQHGAGNNFWSSLFILA